MTTVAPGHIKKVLYLKQFSLFEENSYISDNALNNPSLPSGISDRLHGIHAPKLGVIKAG